MRTSYFPTKLYNFICISLVVVSILSLPIVVNAVCGDFVVDLGEQCDGSACCTSSCTIVTDGRACRSLVGPCDATEYCDGISANCPTDLIMPAGVVCRAAAGTCDQAETCTGASVDCPSDLLLPGGSVCRVSAGPCDVVEECSGVATGCPSDTYQGTDYSCRPASGACDVEEKCNGFSASCPVDKLASSGTTCRAAVSSCDRAETCNGQTNTCPIDTKLPAGTVCRALVPSTNCDLPETCNGVSDFCPNDVDNDTLCASSLVCVSKLCQAVCLDESVVSSLSLCGADNFICPLRNPVLLSGDCTGKAGLVKNDVQAVVSLDTASPDSLAYPLCASIDFPVGWTSPLQDTAAAVSVRCVSLTDPVVHSSVVSLSIKNSASNFATPITIRFQKWTSTITAKALDNMCLAVYNSTIQHWECEESTLVFADPNIVVSTTATGLLAIVDVCDGAGRLAVGKTICSCFSGYAASYGATDCMETAPSECARLALAKLNTTTAEHHFVESLRFEGDRAIINIASNLVANRTVTNVRIIGADAACNYPGVHATKHFSMCMDVWSITIPWSMNSICGFVRNDTDPDYLYYFANMEVTSEDLVGMLRNVPAYRNITNVLRVGYRFQKFLEISTDFTVYSSFNTTVIESSHNYNSSAAASVLNFVTSIPYPFMLTSPVVTLPSNYFFVSIDQVSSCSAVDENTPCTQQWKITYVPKQGICTLTGNFTIFFTVACMAGTICPLSFETTNYTTIEAIATSTDFCAIPVDPTAPITLSAKIYYNDALTQVPSYFTIGQQMYIVIKGVASSAYQILGCNLDSLSIDSRYLVLSGVPIDQSLNLTVQTRLQGTVVVLGLDQSLVGTPLAAGESRALTFDYSAFVIYDGAVTRKRVVLEIESESQVKRSSSFRVTVSNLSPWIPPTTDTTSGGLTTGGGITTTTTTGSGTSTVGTTSGGVTENVDGGAQQSTGGSSKTNKEIAITAAALAVILLLALAICIVGLVAFFVHRQRNRGM